MSVLKKFLAKRNPNPKGEMSFLDHIEELRWHIVRSIIALILAAIIVFINIEWVFHEIILGPARPDFISYVFFCKFGQWFGTDVLCLEKLNLQFQNTVLSGQFMMSFSVSFMLGFILAFPYIFYEFWKFLKPALHPSELKYAKGIIFWSSLLFFLGVAFAYFILAPFTINFFANYQLSPSFQNIITIGNYYDTMSDLILGMGVVFELPVIVFFLSRTGILTPQFMRDKRKYAIVIIMFISAIITPPDMFSIFLVAIPLVLLYEASIFICGRIVKERAKKELMYRK